jgi:hypothetical protein
VDAILIEIEETEQGIEIFDQIQRTRFELHFDGEIGPAETDVVEFPVDTAVRLETSEVTIPIKTGIWVRRGGEHCESTTGGEPRVSILAGGEQLQLNISDAPVKTYLVTDSSVEITASSAETRIQTTGNQFVLGVRSLHELPQGTITTTDDPLDIMRAVSMFSSALQTTSPERAWPTLRGHPPEIECGDELDIPNHITRPDTGIRIETPPEITSIYTLTPLSYYLGAELVPNHDGVRLVTPEIVEPLGKTRPLHEDVGELLPHCFLLDAVTRSEGIYQTTLKERELLASQVDVDFGQLYEMPIAARTAHYLDVDRSVASDLIGDWPLTTTVTPVPENADILPYLADELSLIRPPGNKSMIDTTPKLSDFLRSQNDHPVNNIISKSEVNTPRHQWVGKDLPLYASRPSVRSFKKRLKRSPSDDGTVRVTVVCNNLNMDDELDGELYSNSSMAQVSVDVQKNLTVDELKTVFKQETEFVHYIGHGEEDGLQCVNGWLDLRTLSETCIDAFLLNGCQSLKQGEALVDAGAIGGVVSLSKISNLEASKLGRELSRLLAYGHSLGISLHILRKTGLADRFAVVGLDGFSIVQCQAGSPTLFHITDLSDGVNFDMYVYQTQQYRLGSAISPHIETTDWCLNTGKVGSFKLPGDEAVDFFTEFDTPAILNEDLHWSRDLFET